MSVFGKMKHSFARVLGQAHFDAIYLDACHPAFRYGAICPVEAFLTKDGAKLLHDALADNGIFLQSKRLNHE